VLLGALKVWDVQASVSRDDNGFVLRTSAGMKMRIARAAPSGWRLFREARLLGEAAGMPGLLRLLREELAPHAARGRLIIGSPRP